jgi:hypothetical protein
MNTSIKIKGETLPFKANDPQRVSDSHKEKKKNKKLL